MSSIQTMPWILLARCLPLWGTCHDRDSYLVLRGVIFKIQPLRNPTIFNNMICVLISKVLLMGMSNHPHFEIFWTSSKIWRIRIFFQNSKFHVRKNCCWCHQWASINKNFDEKKFPKFQNFHVKNGSSVKWKKNSKHYLPIISWK